MVDLADLTRSMSALADEYVRFLSRSENTWLSSEAKCRLYVKSVRSGSIEIDLLAMAVNALPFVEHANTVIGFTSYLKNGVEWLSGKKDKNQDDDLGKASLDAFKNLVGVTAKDSASVMVFVTQNNNFNIDSTQARAVRDGVALELEKTKTPVAGIKKNAVLYWYQARNGLQAAGDKAVIESISRSPVKTMFQNDELKNEILLKTGQNPFKIAFVVDVIVESIDDKPILYTVQSLVDVIDLD